MGCSHTKTYYLNVKTSTMDDGRAVAHYFFTPEEYPETACDLPAGYEVGENPANGLPFVCRRADQPPAAPDPSGEK